MNSKEIILTVLEASGGSVQGKTRLQKVIYFLSILLDVDLNYEPHYFGPYSGFVDESLMDLTGIGFVKESCTGFGYPDKKGFEYRRFDYEITPDGNKLLENIKEKSEGDYEKVLTAVAELGELPDYFVLSIAAKIFYVIREKGEVTRRGFKEEARKLEWGDIDDGNIDTALDFLTSRGFVTITKET